MTFRSGLMPGWGMKTTTDSEALTLIRKAVARRRSLAYGQLNDDGKCCALGAYFADNPKLCIPSHVADEVARFNDSIGKRVSPKTRWKKVLAWLNKKTEAL